MKSKSAFCFAELMILVVIIGLLVAIAVPAFKKVREATSTQTSEQYEAWCKLANRHDITYQEWRVLKNGRLLESYKYGK